ncbi:MAG: hypothetical protein H0V63_09525 [Burkholderiaceae bacterium]|nr:hypothetical protein [Burkholderiaceae bacterium]
MNTIQPDVPVPSSRGFTLVGITYSLYAIGLFLVWPALIGVVMAYVKRADVPALLSSHYRWLINTFWWWFATWVVVIAVLLAVMIPYAFELDSTARSAQYFNIPWEVLGPAVLGGLALVSVWLWVMYRLIRGAIRLSDGRAAPGYDVPTQDAR